MGEWARSGVHACQFFQRVRALAAHTHVISHPFGWWEVLLSFLLYNWETEAYGGDPRSTESKR